MKNRQHPLRFSQILSLALFAGAVLVMVAPFRGDGGLTRTSQASMLPILSTASLAHGASFQARDSAERVWSSEGSQFRSAAVAKRLLAPRREIVVRKVVAAVPTGWGQPRTEWKHLNKAGRTQLDAVAAAGEREVWVQGTGTLRGDLPTLMRMTKSLGLGRSGVERVAGRLVVGNGSGAADGAVTAAAGGPDDAGPLVIYLVGDFHRQPATGAQWEALDEVLDYLEMKWGRVRVSLPGAASGDLGPLFPLDRFWQALAETDA
jgi:hypothetical protein